MERCKKIISLLEACSDSENAKQHVREMSACLEQKVLDEAEEQNERKSEGGND